MLEIRTFLFATFVVGYLIQALACTSFARPRIVWNHLSSEFGEIPAPNGGDQQTASLVVDVDNDGDQDFFIGERTSAPAVLLYKRESNGWTKYVVEAGVLNVEAGGAVADIDGDGDLDIAFGQDYQGGSSWWWENPFPNFDPAVPWERHLIKTGGVQHHDQQFGDFDDDGAIEYATWENQEERIEIYEIPPDPTSGGWILSSTIPILGEGMDVVDVDLDGVQDIIAGVSWIKFDPLTGYTVNEIAPGFPTPSTRIVGGQFNLGGSPEVVLSAGEDVDGPVIYYELNDGTWEETILIPSAAHAHSLDKGDIDGDGNLDIFVAEMGNPGAGANCRAWIFWGDGLGNFESEEISVGLANHESRLADLDGDGDLDILIKPYNFGSPRIDVFINEGLNSALSLNDWERNLVDPSMPWIPLLIDVADIDNDGLPDIVAGGWWYKNPGQIDGVWVRSAIGLGLSNMAWIHDFDNDGDVDIFGSDGDPSGSGAMSWAQNNGTGAFTIFNNVDSGESVFFQGAIGGNFGPEGAFAIAMQWNGGEDGNSAVDMFTIPSDPTIGNWEKSVLHSSSTGEDMEQGDIDGDGDIDIFQGTTWLRNNGSSAWDQLTAATFPEEYGGPDRVELIDIDLDGDLDGVVGFSHFNGEDVELVWLENPVDPTTNWPITIVANDVWGGYSLDAKDIDLDGSVDILLGEHQGATRALIFENQESGQSWIEHTVDSGGPEIDHHNGTRLFDLDLDGDLDIVSIGWFNPKLWIYENTSPVFVDEEAPSIPENLTVEPIVGPVMVLTWSQSSDNFGVTSYLIYRDGVQIGSSTSNSFIDEAPADNVTHSYSVQAVDGAGNASASSISVDATALPVASNWWDHAWSYRTTIRLEPDTIGFYDRYVEYPINFTELLPEGSPSVVIDVSTIRIVEVSQTGDLLNDSVPFQFSPDIDFDETTNAKGILVFPLEGDTLPSTSRYYQVYFSREGTGAFPFLVSPLVQLTQSVIDEEQDSFQIDTQFGTLFYQKTAGGFSSLLDTDGNDWLNFHPTGGSAGNFRGIPNLVYPEGYFHPGSTSAVSVLEEVGPLKVTIRSQINNGEWECLWEFFPHSARLTILSAPVDYWFLYEGTPGGSLDVDSDFIVRSTGESTPASQSWVGDITGSEWVYVQDSVLNRALFIAHHEGDFEVDSYYPLNDEMTVLGFGRDSGVGRYLDETPKTFSIGLINGSTFQELSPLVESTFYEPQISPVGVENNFLVGSSPTQPQNLQFSNVTESSLQLSWDESTGDNGIAHYHVYRDGVLVGSPSSNSFQDSGLLPQTSYSYQVEAVDFAGGMSPLSEVANTETLADSEAPSIPQNLTVTPTSIDAMTVSWDEATDNVGVTLYRLFRGGEEIATLTDTSFLDYNLELGTPYSYTLLAEDGAGNQSSLTDASQATTLSKLPLGNWTRHLIDNSLPSRAVFIEHGDVDGDGLQDVLTGAWWYLNPGRPDGNWESSAIGAPLNNVATVFDFDEDGDLDVFGNDVIAPDGVSSGTGPNLAWAENDGSGVFTTRVVANIPDGNFFQGVAVDRFGPNGSGPIEIALSWQNGTGGTQALTVPLNPTTDDWTLRTLSTTAEDEGIDAVDIDGDGDSDLFTGTNWLRNEQGFPWTTFALSETRTFPERSKAVDMNADGLVDVVVSFGIQAPQGDIVWYERPQSDPTVPWTEHLVATITNPMSLDVADIDGDGDLDIAVGEHSQNDPETLRFLIYENADGIGETWIEHLVYTGDEHHDGGVLVDIDNDGDLDIISIGWFVDDQVVLYENLALTDRNPPTVPAGLVSTLSSDSSVDLNWNSSADESNVVTYQIFRNGAFLGSTMNTFFSDGGLSPETTYDYHLIANDPAGNESAASSSASVTTDADSDPPTPPQTLSATASNSFTIDLQWASSTDNFEVAFYRILQDGVEIDTSTVTEYTVTGLEPGSSLSYTVRAVDGSGNESDVSEAILVETPPSPFLFWYGNNQVFGNLGVPQSQINVLGNVANASQIASLSFSLNGTPQGEISIGPEENVRLGRTGDFNVEIPFTDLVDGLNEVSVTATYFSGDAYTEMVTVDATLFNTWPRTYTIDWSEATRIDDVAQVVDGKWDIVPEGVKVVEPHFDRLIAIGDLEWNDFEVTVPITVHSIDPQPFPLEPLVGVMLRWDGHEQVFAGEQPGTEWRPIGAMGVHGWYEEGSRGGAHFEIFETAADKFSGYPGMTLPLETPYYFKMRVETLYLDAPGRYSFKVWPVGEAEPVEWGITRQATGGLREGSLLLVAHYVEATFGDVVVTPFEPSTDPPPNLINGGFESGVPPWTFYTSGSGNAVAASPGYAGANAVRVTINTAASNIQLFQSGISLEPATEYRLTFAAYSSSGRDLRVSLNKHTSPYTNYGLNQKQFDLSTGWQTFTFDFTTAGFGSPVGDARLFFWLAANAQAGDVYYIDEVSLEPVSSIGEPDVQPPSMPTGLTASLASDTEVQLVWVGASDNVGVSGYFVYRDGAEVGTSGSPSFLDTGLAPASSFVYEVTAFDEAGNESSLSNSASIETPTVGSPPSIPQNVQASGLSETEISMVWDPSTDDGSVVEYRIFRDGAQIGTSATTFFTDSGLLAETAYEYEVLAVDDDLNASGLSDRVQGLTLADTTPPTVPEGLQATGQSASSIQIEWLASTDNYAMGNYRVLRDGTEVAVVNEIEFLDTGLGPGSSHNYSVEAVDAAGNPSGVSDEVTGETLLEDPEPAPNALSNGGFESGIPPWTFYTSGSGSAVPAGPGYAGSSAARITINTAASNIQLFQPNLNLEPNTDYRISFAAYSSTGRDLRVSLNKHTSPYTNYGLNQKLFDLSTSWQTFTFDFTTTGFAAPVGDARLFFWLAANAQGGDVYYIDEVSLAPVGSGSEPDSEPPASPTSLTASLQSDTEVQLAWAASSDNVGVAGYRVYRDGAEVGTSNSTGFLDVGLPPSGSFVYEVTSFDDAGNESSPSNSASIETPTVGSPPSIPQNVQASGLSETEISLVWDPSTDDGSVVEYRVFRDGTQIGTSTSTSFTDSGLSADTGYQYRVEAVDDDLNASGLSDPVLGSTLADTTPPSVPGGLQATGQSASSIQVTWLASTDNYAMGSYRVLRDGAEVAVVNETEFLDTGLGPGSNHNYSVEAVDAAGNFSGVSGEVTGETLLEDPEPAPNTLSNGGFESGIAAWTFYTSGSGSAVSAGPGYADSSAARVTINTSASNIQLFQHNLTLEPNTDYRLTFAAYSSTGRDLRVSLNKHTSPYTNYGLNREKFNLATDWQVFTIEFTTKGFSSTIFDGRLYFWFASDAIAGEVYYIDDVVLNSL